MLPFPNYYISTPIMSEKKKTIITSYSKRTKKIWPPTLFTGGVGERGGGGGGDDLAAVKAAAWAWYQRNEGKPMIREFDHLTRATRKPLPPSRYKLEANKKMVLSENRVSQSCPNSLLLGDQDKNVSNLLDTYEIKSISKRIDEESLPVIRGSVFRRDGHNYDDHVLLKKKKIEDDSKKEDGFVRKVSMRNLWKGMIMMAPRTVCGRSDDVNLGAYGVSSRIVKVAPTRVNTRTL